MAHCVRKARHLVSMTAPENQRIGFTLLDLYVTAFSGQMLPPSLHHLKSIAVVKIDEQSAHVLTGQSGRITRSKLLKTLIEPFVTTVDLGLAKPEETFPTIYNDVAMSSDVIVVRCRKAHIHEPIHKIYGKKIFAFMLAKMTSSGQRLRNMIDCLLHKENPRGMIRSEGPLQADLTCRIWKEKIKLLQGVVLFTYFRHQPTCEI